MQQTRCTAVFTVVCGQNMIGESIKTLLPLPFSQTVCRLSEPPHCSTHMRTPTAVHGLNQCSSYMMLIVKCTGKTPPQNSDTSLFLCWVSVLCLHCGNVTVIFFLDFNFLWAFIPSFWMETAKLWSKSVSCNYHVSQTCTSQSYTINIKLNDTKTHLIFHLCVGYIQLQEAKQD